MIRMIEQESCKHLNRLLGVKAANNNSKFIINKCYNNEL